MGFELTKIQRKPSKISIFRALSLIDCSVSMFVEIEICIPSESSNHVLSSRMLYGDLFTIGEVCLQFRSTRKFIDQQYGTIFKQDDHFQTHFTGNRAT